MAGVRDAGVDTEAAKPVELSSESARRRRMEVHQFRFFPLAVSQPLERGRNKRQRFETAPPHPADKIKTSGNNNNSDSSKELHGFVSKLPSSSTLEFAPLSVMAEPLKFGMTSVCGRRRDMEDAVAIHHSFSKISPLHFYAVYDGHGCSHVAMKCDERMHEIVKEELEMDGNQRSWDEIMKTSFSRMDNEITEWSNAAGVTSSPCRCELRTPKCDAVGSTAVVVVVSPEKIIVSNCGDSRAVLCRNGIAIPLSVDHKPNRPDELTRIEAAGGRVIYWDGARVFGVLAMSRAIGDNYLKPFVISEPEVTITDRSSDDECLIIASDGLWDVVSNETACGVARMCLKAGTNTVSQTQSPGNIAVTAAGESSDKACSDASILLSKLALARQSTDNVSVLVVDLRRNL